MYKKSSSTLDNLETSGTSRPPSTYRSYCEKHLKAELEATRNAYSVFDAVHHSGHVDSLDSCRTGAWFVRNKVSGKVRVLSSACHQRWCPMCSSTRRWFLTQEVSAWLKTAEQPKLLTLTLAHTTSPLANQILHLYNCFKKYRKLQLLRRNVTGGVWFFQIKKSSKDGLWHPHLHCVLDSTYIDKRELSAAWATITVTSNIIDIKAVYDIEKAAVEVARYASRPSMLYELSTPDRLTLVESLHGRRLVGTWGNARSITLRPSKPSDSDDWIYIAKYSTVSLFHDQDYRANAIWTAYIKDDVLGEGCGLSDLERALDGEVERAFDGPIVPHQALLDFY